MQYLEVILPGGLPRNGCVERHARFRPLTGRIEQSLLESGSVLSGPGYATAVLGLALESIGNEPADAKCLTDLCVADRQYLMLRLAAMLDGEQMWLKIGCGHCDAFFDVDIRRCDLPVKQAGFDFPQVTLQLKEWVIDLRVPTGEDQKQIQELSEDEGIRHLLQRCIRMVNGEPPDTEFSDNLSGPDIEAIDDALDEASPAVCNQLLVTCPECGREQSAKLDHYELTGLNRNDFYDEVHILASHYHWSETAILDLPQTRRRLYLDLINRSTGINVQERRT